MKFCHDVTNREFEILQFRLSKWHNREHEQ